MEPILGSRMSALDKSKLLFKSSVIFPTLDDALRLVLDKLKREFGEIIEAPTEGFEAGQWPGLNSPPGGSSNTIKKLNYKFLKNGIETKKRLAIRCTKSPVMKLIETEKRIAGIRVGTYASPRLLAAAAARAARGAAAGAAAEALINEELNKLKIDARKNEYNWIEASDLGLSPKLYFYGYTTSGGIAGNVGDINQSTLTLCAISEAYDFDVHQFYDHYNWAPENYLPLPPGPHRYGVRNINDIIRIQFTNLFERMAKEMNMICFDIKPQNAVINYDVNTHTVDVKLIDWDANMCKQYTQLRPWAKEYAAILMEMIMAMFFYLSRNNIFSNHLTDVLHKRGQAGKEKMRQALKTLFCSENFTDFAAFAIHYFVRHNQPANVFPRFAGREKLPEPAVGMHRLTNHQINNIREHGMNPYICGVLFDSIYERVIFKNPDEYNLAARPQGNQWEHRRRPIRGIATGSPARPSIGASPPPPLPPPGSAFTFGIPGPPDTHATEHRYHAQNLSIMHTSPQEARVGGGKKNRKKKYRTSRKKRKKRSRTRRKCTRTRQSR